jgi:hypothetical protein
MNDFYKSIDWLGRTKSVQGISYKQLIQILFVSLHLVIPVISMVLALSKCLLNKSPLYLPWLFLL